MKSENKNFLLNIIFQLLTLALSLITTPYISRVLGVKNIGIYSYTYSIVYIFMLVGMLGINNYGNRSIAAVRDDKEQMSKTFISIYLLQVGIGILALLAYFFYVGIICTQFKKIAFIQSIFLFSICFDINWFYFGMEKFKLTIFRNLTIKLVSLALIFSLVKTHEDLPIYTSIMAGTSMVCQICLVMLLPKYIVLVKVTIKDIFIHFKDVIILFIPVLAFGIYKVMDKTMIGMLSSVTELGYYENAEKLLNIPLAVITALGTVMLPRMSYLSNKNVLKYKTVILQSMTLSMKLSTIMCAGLILIADEAVIILFGNDFVGSKPIIRLLSITVIASAWANVIRTQFLIPLKKDKIYVFSTLWAAILNFALNIVLIPRYGSIGACVGTVAAEYFVAIYQTISIRNEYNYKHCLRNTIMDMLKAAMIAVIAYYFTLFIRNIVIKLLMKIVIAVLLFISINTNYLKNDFFCAKRI